MNKTTSYLVSILAIAAIGGLAWLGFLNDGANDGVGMLPPLGEPIETTLVGEYLCLPHTEQGDFQTMECALGMKADDGAYYALDLSALPGAGADFNFETGTRIRVRGLLVPIEQISSDLWRIYPVRGIMRVDTATLAGGEIGENPEGEADPSRMTLGMTTWKWMRALYNDGRVVAPQEAGVFTLTFADGRFSATTDCNSMSGEYSVSGNTITFGPIASTKMYCEGSQEGEFARLLQDSTSYHFTSRGELVLDLKFDSGTVVFR